MEGIPNTLAYLALILCPFVSIAIVGLVRASISVPIVLLGGQMFLPPMVKLDIPFLQLDKDVLPALGALAGCLIFRRKILRRSRPWRGYDLFIVAQILGLFGTFLTNEDPLAFGQVVLPGLSFHDFLNNATNVALYWWPPFFLGRALYRNSKDLRNLFIILAIAGFVYSAFLFTEMLLSPQWNRWIYGFHQTDFNQTLRAGGYRPKAFMRHGLNVALFVLMTVLGSAVLARNKIRIAGIPAIFVLAYLVVVLVLCKSLGVMLYAVMFLPLVGIVSPSKQTKVAAILAVLLFSYPLFRASGLVPVEDINRFSMSKFGEDRAESLAMRLREEGFVMERALKRIVFGWGGYAREFRHDPVTGENLTVIDGFWALQIGMRGVVGYVALFGMLLLPAWRARRSIAKTDSPTEQAMIAGLALMAVTYVVDLIPNSSIDPYLTFLVGVLAGTERGLVAPAKAIEVVPEQWDPLD